MPRPLALDDTIGTLTHTERVLPWNGASRPSAITRRPPHILAPITMNELCPTESSVLVRQHQQQQPQEQHDDLTSSRRNNTTEMNLLALQQQQQQPEPGDGDVVQSSRKKAPAPHSSTFSPNTSRHKHLLHEITKQTLLRSSKDMSPVQQRATSLPPAPSALTQQFKKNVKLFSHNSHHGDQQQQQHHKASRSPKARASSPSAPSPTTSSPAHMLADIDRFLKRELRGLADTYGLVEMGGARTTKKGGKFTSPHIGGFLDGQELRCKVPGSVVMTEEERYRRERLECYRHALDAFSDQFPTYKEFLKNVDKEYMSMVSFLTSNVGTHQEVIVGLRKELTRMRREVESTHEEADTRVAAVEATVAALRENEAKLTADIQEERLKYTAALELHSRLRRLERQLSEAETIRAGKDEEISNLKKTIENMTLETFTDQLIDMSKQLTQHKDRTEELNNALDVATDELDDAKADTYRLLVGLLQKVGEEGCGNIVLELSVRAQHTWNRLIAAHRTSDD